MNLEQLFLGLSLASAAGLRAFLPLLVLSLMARYGHLPLSAHFHWLASPAALIVLTVATVFELLADKIPVVDHALDALQTVVRPVAGAIAVAGSQSQMDPTMAAVVALILGATVAGGIHAVKGAGRLASTAGTAGIANPFLSVAEDILALFLSVLGVVAPVAGVALAVLVVLAAYRAWRLWRARRARQA